MVLISFIIFERNTYLNKYTEFLNIFLDNMEKNYYLIKLNTFILPSSKERWLTSAIQIENSIVVGDRDGSVHVYFDKVGKINFSAI